MPDTQMALRLGSQGKGAEDFLQVHLKCEMTVRCSRAVRCPGPVHKLLVRVLLCPQARGPWVIS